ncbi:MAG: TerB family tellurite resistance protein [Candidatus Limnocylindrales bacterium]
MRFLGSRPGEPAGAEATATQSLAAETEAVRRIVARLEALPPDKARLLAGMAYVLARAAYADMDISDAETDAMAQELSASGLDQSQAVLVVEMAKLQEKTGGGTNDYLVTREFRELSTMEQRMVVLRACFRVCAADDAISGMESATLDEIASELDIAREDLHAVRAEFADKFSARLGFGTSPSGQG